MKRRLKQAYLLLKKAAVKYRQDDPVRLAGTAAYFMVFAMIFKFLPDAQLKWKVTC